MSKIKKEERFCGTIYSTNFMNNFSNTNEKCFIPLSEYNALKRKYIKMFKRYQRENIK